MNHLLALLSKDAELAACVFNTPEKTEGLPFLYGYPHSCCEIASGILALALQKKYPDSKVEVAMAYDQKKNEWHFWVEVDDAVIDVTAHQFPEFSSPLVCLQPSPLEPRFPDIERLSPDTATERLPDILSKRAGEIVFELSCSAT